MLQAAREYNVRRDRIARAGLTAARQVRGGTLTRLTAVVVAAQVAMADEAKTATAAMIAEQGLDATAIAEVSSTGLAGTASDGRRLSSLLELAATDKAFDMIVVTQLRDVARSAGQLVGSLTPSTSGYVRALQTPSCARCAILAGRWYRKYPAFQRHPRCDCYGIPASVQTYGALTTDPQAYFDSLTAADQDQIFTLGGAEAIRNGADITKVVNVRRGMGPAQTRIRPRAKVMPETLIEQAGGDQGRLLTLLKNAGYIY